MNNTFMTTEQCRSFLRGITGYPWMVFFSTSKETFNLEQHHINEKILKSLTDNNIHYIIEDNWVKINMNEIISGIRDKKLNDILDESNI